MSMQSTLIQPLTKPKGAEMLLICSYSNISYVQTSGEIKNMKTVSHKASQKLL